MAVKKATAKKSVGKRPAAKKSASKKSVAKKKSTAKKSVSKKSVAKKVTSKKVTVKKSATKKSTVKKSAARKKSVKSAAKPVDRFIVPPVPVSSLSRAARIEVSTVPAPAPVSIPLPAPAPLSVKKPGPSGRVVFAVVVGIVLLALIVWARGHSRNTDQGLIPTSTPTATATATETASATPTPTPLTSATTVITAHTVPQGVVAHYTTPGATIFWNAPTAVDGLTGYNIEISVSSGPWKLISTVPATQTSLDIVKVNSNGWTSFRVSSVYSDSQITSAKAFGLPGTYS